MGTLGLEGRVAGRYLRSDGTAPTGRVRMILHPTVNGVDRPPMALFTTDIIAGWFSLFFVEGMNFTYVIEATQEKIFDKTNLTAIASTTSSYKAVYKLPDFYERRDSNLTEGFFRSASQHVFGFFGGGASLAGSAQSCYPTSGFSSNVYSDIYGKDYLWFSTSPSPTQMGPSAGGVSDSTCATPTVNSYVTQLHYRPEYPDRSEDRSFGIKGPFRYLTDKGPGDFVERVENLGDNTDVTSSWVRLTWRYLPYTSGLIDGVTIYMKTGYMSDGGGGPFGTDCQRIAYKGYDSLGDFTYGTTSTLIDQTDLPSGISRFALPYSNFVLCPYKEGAGPGGTRYYYTSGVVSRPTVYVSANATEIYAIVPDVYANYLIDSTTPCRKYWLHVMDTTGTLVTPSSSSPVYIQQNPLDASGESVQVWSDASCSTSLSSITPSATSNAFYLSRSGTGGVTEISAYAPNSFSRSIFIAGSGTASTTGYAGLSARVPSPLTYVRGSCSPLYLSRDNSGLTTSTTSVSMSSLSGPELYYDSYCNGATVDPATLNILSNEFYKVLYFKPTTIGAGNIGATPTVGIAASVVGMTYIDHIPAQLYLPVSPTLSACASYAVEVQNASSQKVPLNIKQTVTLNFTSTSAFDIKIYDSLSECTSTSSSYIGFVSGSGGTDSVTLDMGQGQSTATLYMRAVSTAATFSVTATSSPISLTGASGTGLVNP